VDSLLGRNLGQYRIVERIGAGGMAAVYKAFQPTLDRYVAIKVLPPIHSDRPEFSERFQREARAIAQLNHPNIVPVHDFGQDGDFRFLVMRYIDGAVTLRDTMRNPLGLPQITDLVCQVAGALAHAHMQGIVHRDVKPTNVMMDGQWALLTDFGLARMAEALVELTGSGMGVGTPAYMSPEQGRGLPVDHRSDIYSLGIVLFEMLTGHIPHNAETPFAIVFRRITEPLPLPRTLNPDIPEGVERVVLKALATDPDHRFGSADEMAQALRRAAEGKDRLVLGQSVVGIETQRTSAVPTQAAMTAFFGPPAAKTREDRKQGVLVPLWAMLPILVGLTAVVGAGAFWAGRAQFQLNAGSAPLKAAVTTVESPTPSALATPTAAHVVVTAARQTEAPRTSTPVSSTPTGARSPGITPTITPTTAPSITPTSIPTFTPTFTPIPSLTPTIIASPTIATTREAPVTMPVSTGGGALSLLQPLPPDDPDFAATYGPTTFAWTYDGPLSEDQGFEVRVWREGEMPTGAHDAVADNLDGSITSPATGAYQIELDISDVPGVQGRTGDYFWTVLLVQIEPEYRELGVQAPLGQLRFEAPGGGSDDGGGGGGSKPTF
jgi:hypothetical protein